MDWFERLTGFRETNYDDTRRQLVVAESHLRSLVNGRRYGIGKLELVSLETLRQCVRLAGGVDGRVKLRVVCSDVRLMHRLPEFGGALFQVASQFNLLQMVRPTITPEHGVTRYERDRTQGPACAIAAGAAAIYRNYFVPVGGQVGQTEARQLDGLAGVGRALGEALNLPVASLWDMRNGHAECSDDGLESITRYLASLQMEEAEMLMGELCIGVHRDVEVTDGAAPLRPVVSQAYCAPLSGACSRSASERQALLASLLLNAAYEATLLAAVLNARRGASNIVVLTWLGDAACGHDAEWVLAAIRRALRRAENFGLDVRLVSDEAPSREMLQLAEEFA